MATERIFAMCICLKHSQNYPQGGFCVYCGPPPVLSGSFPTFILYPNPPLRPGVTTGDPPPPNPINIC